MESNIIDLAKTYRENGWDEVNTALHALCKSESLWIIKQQSFTPRYHLNQSKLQANRNDTNMTEANFETFFNDWLVNIRNFSSQNFANNMNKPELYFES